MRDEKYAKRLDLQGEEKCARSFAVKTEETGNPDKKLFDDRIECLTREIIGEIQYLNESIEDGSLSEEQKIRISDNVIKQHFETFFKKITFKEIQKKVQGIICLAPNEAPQARTPDVSKETLNNWIDEFAKNASWLTSEEMSLILAMLGVNGEIHHMVSGEERITKVGSEVIRNPIHIYNLGGNHWEFGTRDKGRLRTSGADAQCGLHALMGTILYKQKEGGLPDDHELRRIIIPSLRGDALYASPENKRCLVNYLKQKVRDIGVADDSVRTNLTAVVQQPELSARVRAIAS